ncbi:MAG: O-antigen ligase family protein [Bacteroidota bacterium]
MAFIFLYTTFNGALRKWVWNSGILDFFTFLLQMGMLVVVAFAFRRKLMGDVKMILGLYALALILFAFNPLNQTIIHGAVGFVLHFGIWLTCFIYYQNRDLFPYEKMIKLSIIILFIQFGLGLVQYNLPNTHFINKYIADDSGANAFVGDRVRITGTFSYISGFTAFLGFCGFFIWALAVKRVNLLLRYVLTFLSFICVLMSGSRSIFIIFSLPVLASVIEDFLQPSTRALGIASIVVLIFIGPLLYTNLEFVNIAVNNYADRVATGASDRGDQDRRVTEPWQEILKFRGDQPVFGLGLGATYAGVNKLLGKSYFVREYGYYEEIAERIVVEGGFVLFFIRIGMFALLYLYSNLPRLYLLPFLVITTFYFNLCFNIPNMIYFIIGFCMVDKAYHLRTQQQLKAT